MLIIWLLFLRHFVKLFTLLKWHKFFPPLPIRPLSVWFPPSSLAEVTNSLAQPNTCFYKVFLYHHLFPASPPPTHHKHMLWWEDILVSHHLQCWGEKFPLLQAIFFIFKTWFVKCKWHRASFSLSFFNKVHGDALLCLEGISGRESKNIWCITLFKTYLL